MIYDSSSISQSLPVLAHQHRPSSFSFFFFWSSSMMCNAIIALGSQALAMSPRTTTSFLSSMGRFGNDERLNSLRLEGLILLVTM